MPVDARIPLSAQPPNPIDLMQIAGQALTLRNLGQRNQLYQAQIEQDRAATTQRQRALDDEAAINATLQRHAQQSGGKPDPDAVVSDLMSQGRGNAASAFHTHIQTQRKAQAEMYGKTLDNSAKALGIASGMLRDATPETYAAVRPQIAAIVGEEVVNQYLPAEYDAVAVQGVVSGGMDTQERLARTAEAAKKIAAGPKTAQEWTTTFATALGASGDDASYEQTYNVLADLADPVGKKALGMFPKPGTKNAPALAGQMGITPEKRAELAGQDETRKETGRHNKVIENADAVREKRLSEQGGETPSAAGRATAERWLQGRLTSIDTAFKKQGTYDPLTGVTQPAMTEDEKKQKTLEAVNSARRQVNRKPTTEVPKDMNRWDADETVSAVSPPANGPAKPLSSHNRPQPSTETPTEPAAPAPASTPAAPAPTRKAMTRAKAADILQGLAKRTPTKAEIDRFMQRNPFEQ